MFARRLAKYIFPAIITGLAIAALALLGMLLQKSHTHPPPSPSLPSLPPLPPPPRPAKAYRKAKAYKKPKKGCGHRQPHRRPAAASRPVLLRAQPGRGQPAPYVAAGSTGAAPLR
jgi:hypothetical protein